MSKYPPDMQQRTVPLTHELGPAYGVSEVGVVSYDPDKGKGDGWVLNLPENAPFSGYKVHKSTESTDDGKRSSFAFVPVDNVLLRTERILHKNQHEMDRIAGSSDCEGNHLSGEIDDLVTSRLRIFAWLSLTPSEQDGIKKFYTNLYKPRRAARNPENKSIATRSKKLSTMQDDRGRENIGAMLAMTHPLQSDLTDRGQQTKEVKKKNISRYTRDESWLEKEALRVRDSYEIADWLREGDNPASRWDSLHRISGLMRFYVQPYNQLGAAINSCDTEAIPEEFIIHFQEGLEFMRYKGYVLTPMRWMNNLETFSAASRNRLTNGINERLMALAELSLHEAYDSLRSRLMILGETVLDHIAARDFDEAERTAQREFKPLLINHCLPGEAEQMNEWYGHPLNHVDLTKLTGPLKKST